MDDGKLIPDEKMDEIRAYLLGTCESEIAAFAAFEIPPEAEDEVRDRLYDGSEGIVVCEQCGWWVEIYETDEDGYCEQCQSENGDEE